MLYIIVALLTRMCRYFGAARNLPGVRELFQPKEQKAPKRTRAELYRDIDADYYGYRDDEDGILVRMEAEAERRAIQEAMDAWERERQERMQEGGGQYQDANNDLGDDELEVSEFEAHVPVPTLEDMDKLLLEQKKQALLEKYVAV
jgi:pre-mRNA-splicing factor ISY1